MSIRLEDVSYVYAPKTPFEFEALKHVTLEIKEGSFTALVGHTGSGKSTLIQHLNALLLPTSGKIIMGDFEMLPKSKLKEIKTLRKYAGIVFQFPEYQLFEDSVEKDVMFGPKNFGLNEEEARKKAREALTLVGIPESYYKRSPFELSGGERRRVAIAGIIALEPKVLILDEPTAGLDPQGAREMMELFRQIHERGTTVILVSHDMDIVLEYAEEVIILQDGEVKKQTTPLELFADEHFEDYALDMPLVYRFARACMNRGLSIDLSNIRNTETLAEAIKKARNLK